MHNKTTLTQWASNIKKNLTKKKKKNTLNHTELNIL